MTKDCEKGKKTKIYIVWVRISSLEKKKYIYVHLNE